MRRFRTPLSTLTTMLACAALSLGMSTLEIPPVEAQPAPAGAPSAQPQTSPKSTESTVPAAPPSTPHPPAPSAAPDELAAWYRKQEVPSPEGIATLRARGPEGLAKLFESYDALRKSKTGNEKRDLDEWLDRWIDEVCGQYLCRYSRLYWHEDLPSTLAQARKQGKPILRLRMLGRLDEMMSCANSRFFRTVLYPSEAVSGLLRDSFVLYWDSERTVPKVTIDLENGHQIWTTVTGNSIHYILDSQGRMLDALPGLYDPVTFVEQLVKAQKLSHDVSNLPDGEFLPAVYRFHDEALKQLDSDWEKILSTGKAKGAVPARKQVEREESAPARVDAAAASNRAITKSLTQAPVLDAVSIEKQERLEKLNRNDLWSGLAERYRQGDPISPNSRALIESELFSGGDFPKPDLPALYKKLRETISLDTVRNEFLLHAQLHRWLAGMSNPLDFDTVNNKVYKELFFTPKDDPYMGLIRTDVFTGLPDFGLVTVEEPESGSEPTAPLDPVYEPEDEQ